MNKQDVNIIHISASDLESPYFDRGFLYGESIYDVIPFYGKKPYSVLDHYLRFSRDAKLMKMPFTLSLEDFEAVIDTAIGNVNFADGSVYLQITSGNYGSRFIMPLRDEQATIIALAFESIRPTISCLLGGVKLVLFPENRGSYCHVKSTNRLSTRLAMLHAKDHGATESIWYEQSTGLIHEGCSSNIFFIADHHLITPALSPYIFPGLAREKILSLAEQLGVVAICRDIFIDELRHFQGAFITGCTKQLVPVKQLEQAYYSIHPLWATMFKAYNDHIDLALSG